MKAFLFGSIATILGIVGWPFAKKVLIKKWPTLFAGLGLMLAVPHLAAQSCPNQPAGMTLVSHRSFTGPTPDWNDTARISFVVDPSAPDGDGFVGRQTYTTTNRVGSATMASFHSPNFQRNGIKVLYTCYRVRLDSTFTFSYPGGFFGTKQYWFQVGPSSGENKVFTNFYAPNPGNGDGLTAPVCLGLVLQGVPSEPSHGTWCAKPAGLVTRGRWYQVEMLGKVNSTSSAADGSITMWVDGAVVANRTNVRFTQVKGMTDLSHGAPHTWTKTTDPAEWYATKWDNTLGGGTAYCTAKNTAGAYIHFDAYCFSPKLQGIDMDAQSVWVK